MQVVCMNERKNHLQGDRKGAPLQWMNAGGQGDRKGAPLQWTNAGGQGDRKGAPLQWTNAGGQGDRKGAPLQWTRIFRFSFILLPLIVLFSACAPNSGIFA